MHSKVRLSLVVALVVSLFVGCSHWQIFKRKRPAAGWEDSKVAQQIGTITLVNTEGSFVLVDNGYRMSPSIGATLESRAPDGSIAQLRVTDIRKRPFVIADIVSGIPGKGDLVFEQKKPEKLEKPVSTPLPQ